MTTPPPPVRLARFWPLVSGGAALLLVAGLAALIVYREHDQPFGFDTEWMEEIVEHRSPLWLVPALIFDSLGGGILAVAVVPLVIIAALLLWRRRWAALYFAIAVALCPLIVQLLKKSIGRPRPGEILVTADFGSFPSGHSANAAVMATVLGIIFLRGWVWAAGVVYTVAMMLSRTYLGAHWISDTVGGMLLGVGVAVIVWAPLALRLYREQRMPHPPPWRRDSASRLD